MDRFSSADESCSEIHIRKAYKLILSRLKQKEYSKFYDRRSYRRRIFHNNHRELPDVKIGGLKHENIVSYQTRLQTIKCFHLNDILFHVLGKSTLITALSESKLTCTIKLSYFVYIYLHIYNHRGRISSYCRVT